MLTVAVILFREVLEMALVIGVVLAATGDVAGRHRWVLTGGLAGLAGAGLLAALADRLADSFSGLGSDVLTVAVLLAAGGLIAWTVLWMAQQGAATAARLKQTGQAIRQGQAQVSVLALIVGLAVLREGAEAVLFIAGALAGQDIPLAALISGSGLGILAGALAGTVLYRGLKFLRPRLLFAVSGGLLTTVAAGMIARAAGVMVGLGWVPPLVERLWDGSVLLPQRSPLGQVLSVLIGYQEQPSGLEMLVWLLVVVAIVAGGGALRRRVAPARPNHRKTGATMAALSQK